MGEDGPRHRRRSSDPGRLEQRLYLFWPIFVDKADPNQQPTKQTADNQTTTQPVRHWEIQLAWSEYKHQKWQPKQISKVALISDDGPQGNDRDSSRLRYFFYAVPDSGGLSVFCFHHYEIVYPYRYFQPLIRSGWKGAEFRFSGCGDDVYLRDAWTRTIRTIRGTSPQAMHLVEENDIGLYLPKTLTTSEDGLVLRRTPGGRPV